MRIQETNLYTYDELSDAAKAKARNCFLEGFEFDSEFIINDAADIAALMGFDIRQKRINRPADYKGAPEYKPTVYWSGFSSQGDGACCEGIWRAKDCKPGKVMEHAPQDTELHAIAAEFERLALVCPDGRFSVKHSGHYGNENSTEFDFNYLLPEYDDYIARSPAEWNELEEKRDALESELMDVARQFMQWIYSQLEKEYRYQTSDAVVAENIIANEYEFTADGKVQS